MPSQPGEKIMQREFSETLPRFSPGYEGTENMFYFFYKIKDDIWRAYETVNSYNLETASGFNGTETNCRIAHNLGILLMNSNCFAIFFQ